MRRFIKQATEQMLGDVLGGTVRLGGGEALGSSNRSGVYRFSVLWGPDGAPESVVVKQGKIEETRGSTVGLFNEWAGTRFLAEMGGHEPIGPRFYAGDRETGLLVIEDLKAGEQLVQTLHCGDAETAGGAMIANARAAGRMHGCTVGQRARYLALRRPFGPAGDIRPRRSKLHKTFHRLVKLYFQGTLLKRAQQDLEALIGTLGKPSPFLTYTHNDLGPHNAMRMPDGVRLVDFEFGAFGNPQLDALYGPVQFPAFWFTHRFPDALPPQMTAAYRVALAEGCPDAEDDGLFYRGFVEACLYCTLNLTHQIPGFPGGGKGSLLEQRRRLLMRFETLAKMTEQVGYMEALGAVFGQMADHMREIWPPEVREIPLYPAFESKSKSKNEKAKMNNKRL